MIKLIKKIFKKRSIDTQRKMYLILREDLNFKYIQGAHALAQMAIEHPTSFISWHNEYLICLSVFNGLELQKVLEILNNTLRVTYSVFYEPDLKSNLPTAIALYYDGKHEDAINIVKDLKLATR